MPKLNQARRDQIARLRKDGMSFARIGAKLDPPASKQLVHQTWQKIVDDWGRKGVKRTRA
jgi:hypothetical protein